MGDPADVIAITSAHNRERDEKFTRREIRRTLGDRGLRLLDDHREAIQQAHTRLTALDTAQKQTAADLVTLIDAIRGVMADVGTLRQQLAAETISAGIRGRVRWFLTGRAR